VLYLCSSKIPATVFQTAATGAGAPSRLVSSFIVCSSSHAMVTKAVASTGSEEEAVKLKRPCMRRPYYMASDYMLALPLLPWRACSTLNSAATNTLSSSREVGGHQQEQALKTPGSSNRARADCTSSKFCEYLRSSGSLSSVTQS